MPFTLSHPFFAAPLKRLAPRWLSATGLTLGSMAPDFEYFVAMQAHRSLGHTAAGFFLHALPLGIAFALVFHCVLKPTLPLLLPSAGGWDRFAQDETRPWRLRNLREWLVFLGSLLLGFLSHLFMDGWTHRQTYFYERVAFLRRPVAGDELYHWLQYLFSAIGAAAIALYFIGRWLGWRARQRGAAPALTGRAPQGGKMAFRAIVLVVAAAVFAVKAALAARTGNVGYVLVAPFSAFALGWLAAALLVQAASLRQRALAAARLLLLPALAFAYHLAQPAVIRLAGLNPAAAIRLFNLLWTAIVLLLACYLIWLAMPAARGRRNE